MSIEDRESMEDREKEWYKDIGLGDTWTFSLDFDEVEINKAELLRIVDPIWCELLERKW